MRIPGTMLLAVVTSLFCACSGKPAPGQPEETRPTHTRTVPAGAADEPTPAATSNQPRPYLYPSPTPYITPAMLAQAQQVLRDDPCVRNPSPHKSLQLGPENLVEGSGYYDGYRTDGCRYFVVDLAVPGNTTPEYTDPTEYTRSFQIKADVNKIDQPVAGPPVIPPVTQAFPPAYVLRPYPQACVAARLEVLIYRRQNGALVPLQGGEVAGRWVPRFPNQPGYSGYTCEFNQRFNYGLPATGTDLYRIAVSGRGESGWLYTIVIASLNRAQPAAHPSEPSMPLAHPVPPTRPLTPNDQAFCENALRLYRECQDHLRETNPPSSATRTAWSNACYGNLEDCRQVCGSRFCDDRKGR